MITAYEVGKKELKGNLKFVVHLKNKQLKAKANDNSVKEEENKKGKRERRSKNTKVDRKLRKEKTFKEELKDA